MRVPNAIECKSTLTLPLPMVAAISGNCMGAGLEIASCCDLRIGADNSRYGAPIAKLGFPMAHSEVALLRRVLIER